MASEYLSPYQELIEASVLPDRVMQANMEQNPLYQRDKAALSGIAQPPPAPEEEVAAAAPTAVVANPLVKPPVPLSTMTTDRQIAWQKMQQDAATKQAALERAALELTSGRRKEELDRQGVTQATALLGETGGLRPDDLSNYPQQRTELMRKYPVGAMTNEAKNILSQYDTIYANALQIDKESRGRQDQASIAAQAQRREGGEKTAASLGTDVLSKFYQIEKDQGTEAAIEAVMGEASSVKKNDLVAQLLNTGMTEEDIQKKFTGPQGQFLFGAAEAQAKSRRTPDQEATAALNAFSALAKMREDADYVPGQPNPNWPLEMEKNYQNTKKVYNTLLSRQMKKAGVLDEDIDPNATLTPSPAAGPSPTPGARPTATPSPTPTAKPTPTPPPLNPAYEEKWVNGVRTVKIGGQWYKSKVQ